MGVRTPGATPALRNGQVPVIGNPDRALHYAMVKAATFSALIGQFRHHHPDLEVPASLARADQGAFDDADQLCTLSGGPHGPLYNLVQVVAVAYESGQAHADGDCPFCDPHAELDELAADAIGHAMSVAAAALTLA